MEIRRFVRKVLPWAGLSLFLQIALLRQVIGVMKMLRRIVKYAVVLLSAAALLATGLTGVSAAEGGSLALTDAEQAYIDTAPTLRVGYVQDRIPVSFIDKNGELAGISRFIFDRIAQLSGLKFEYVPLPAGSVTYDYLMSERIDLVTSVEYNKENQGARGIMMSDPYLSSRKVIVARQDFTYSRDDPHSVALCTGSQTLKKVMKESFPNYTLLDYNTINDCFTALKDGEADMMILNQYVVEYWLYKPSYESLKVIPVLGMDDQLCFSAVVPFDENGNPVGENGDTVISVLNKAIAQMADEEVDNYTIRAIMENRYSFTVGDFLYRYRVSVLILSVAVVLIVGLLILLWRQRLQSVTAQADARAKNRFLSAMSHEIRTPLNGLIGLNRLMSYRIDDREQLLKYLDQSTVTTQYLQSLVNDMLDMSMLHQQDVEIEQKPVDLNKLLAAVHTIIGEGMKKKQIDFQMLSELPCPTVIGDGVRIQQVLLHLLDNARKFTSKDGKVKVTVRQSLKGGGRVETVMTVTDTGKGISEEAGKNIFDAFVQNTNTVSKGNQGVGLGLAISHRLARLMEGDLTFTSELGKGSEFVFSFVAGLPDQPLPAKPHSTDSTLKKTHILIAEDNELNGEIMVELLRENGFEATLVANGKQALEAFTASQPGEYGVILMDLLMPEMDGFAACAAIRALDREDAKTVRIFACSANCTVEDRKKAVAAGMDDFFAKPIHVEELLGKIRG